MNKKTYIVKPETEELLIKQKRLSYRSHNRGMKETDVLLGRFADRYLSEFDERKLSLYEALLQESDPDILSWITGTSEIPLKQVNEVTDLLCKFFDYE